jgi:general secretion pathway protein H
MMRPTAAAWECTRAERIAVDSSIRSRIVHATDDRGKNGGFTLVETMLVILVIGLIAALALPYTRTLSPSVRLEAQATKVVAVLRATRAAAIRANADQSVVIDTERFTVTSPATPAARIDPDINIRVVFADRERRSTSQGGIRFFSNGQSTGGRIRLSLGNLTTGVGVNWATGHAGIER